MTMTKTTFSRIYWVCTEDICIYLVGRGAENIFSILVGGTKFSFDNRLNKIFGFLFILDTAL